MEKEKKAKQVKGITLIALVVTIIVLIILASISIGAISNERGIIKQAEEAKNMHEDAVSKQEKDMQELVNEYNSALEENIEATKKYSITIKYVYEGVDAQIIPSKVIENVVNGKKYTASSFAETIEGHVYVYASQDEIIINGKNEAITLYYARDILADPNRDGNGELIGDGIPDKFQYTVSYEAINGSVSISTTIVTKISNDGKPAENGIARLAANQIATATRNPGYSRVGTWNIVPTEGQIITEDTTYRVTFSPDTR